MIQPSDSHEMTLLGWRWSDGAFSSQAYMEGLACLLQRHVNCSAVALWRIYGVTGERTMSCLGQHRASGERLPCDEALSEARLGSYFAALEDRGVYVCAETRNPRDLSAADDRNRRPDPPRAFLDALVSINGLSFGVLTCYQDFGPHHWTAGEVTQLRRLAARVALHLSRLMPNEFDADCDMWAAASSVDCRIAVIGERP